MLSRRYATKPSDEVRVDDHEQVLMVMLWSTFFDLAGIELGEG